MEEFELPENRDVDISMIQIVSNPNCPDSMVKSLEIAKAIEDEETGVRIVITRTKLLDCEDGKEELVLKTGSIALVLHYVDGEVTTSLFRPTSL